MSKGTDVARVYEMIMSVPGMNDPVKLDQRLSRKTALLLNNVIEKGLTKSAGEEGGRHLVDAAPREALDELEAFSKELLQKAGLTEMYEKLKTF